MGKGDEEREDECPLRLVSCWAAELRIEEKLGVKGESEAVFLVRAVSEVEDANVVDKGVSPRRDEAPGAGGPQADGCPLDGRAPEDWL